MGICVLSLTLWLAYQMSAFLSAGLQQVCFLKYIHFQSVYGIVAFLLVLAGKRCSRRSPELRRPYELNYDRRREKAALVSHS